MQRRFSAAAAIGAVALGVLLAACSGHSGGSVIPSAGTAGSNSASAIEAHALAQSGAHVMYSSPGYSIKLTPNYKAGFGPALVGFCSTAPCKPTTPGSGATLGGGSIDFGSVNAGEDYLYRYAMQISIASASQFTLYAEATGNFSGPSAIPADALEWLPTYYEPGSTQDANSPLLPGTPFLAASSPGTGQTFPVTSGHGNLTLADDFILRVPEGAVNGAYSVQLVYTVVQ